MALSLRRLEVCKNMLEDNDARKVRMDVDFAAEGRPGWWLRFSLILECLTELDIWKISLPIDNAVCLLSTDIELLRSCQELSCT
jgi:hypothetical protein